MKKYFSIFKYSLKTNLTFLFDYMFSLFSFAIHIIVFNALWDYILKDGSMFNYTKSELIWYVIITEFITYSIVIFYKKISEMVKDGTIANMLIKPMNFLVYIIFEQSANIIKIFINAIAAIILGTIFAGPINVSINGMILFVISCMLSFVIGMCIQLILGLIAFYIEETKSVWFIIQKFQLLLVFVPIEFYSNFIQKILLLIPTTHMIYAPATIFVKYTVESSIALITMQIISIIALSIITLILYKKGVKKINVNGG